MTSTPWTRALVVLAAVALPTVTSRDADACGGCFGPSETNQVVTDHLMVMALHGSESILWDQIRYSGRPQDFSWVLPVQGDATLELAEGAFFDTLAAITAPTVTAPTPVCPGAGRGAFSGDSTASLNAAESGGVQVLSTAIVGPYMTTTLRSSDADALTTWLRANSYVIPASIEPVIRHYTDLHMDFIALRLRPDEGVQAMQPVRVRFATPSPVLPLRMVSAGIADKVGISLFVVSEGRSEAMNFPNALVDRARVAWDYASASSNYPAMFRAAIAPSGGRAWVTEAAIPADGISFAFRNNGGFADWGVAGATLSRPWVTRLRADLPASALDRDLQLQAATDSVELQPSFQAGVLVNRPPCRTDDGFYSGTDTTSRGLTCSATPGATGARGLGGLLALGLAGAAIRRRRR
jgi:MYXO-CTERM domain-containing protein